MESPSWFPSFHTKQILDFKMSKCSLKYFMATLLIIRDLESIRKKIHGAATSERYPQNTCLKIGGWQKLPAPLHWRAICFCHPHCLGASLWEKSGQ